MGSCDGHIDSIKQMMDKFGAKAVVNVKIETQWTCLHTAAEYGHPNIITLLIENGADPDPKDTDKETPLRVAIKYRQYASITTLIKLGASLEKAKESIEDPLSFGSSMKEKETKAAISKGQKLAGER